MDTEKKDYKGKPRSEPEITTKYDKENGHLVCVVKGKTSGNSVFEDYKTS